MKYVGAAYLIYLSIRVLLSNAPAQEQSKLPRTGVRKAFRDGIVVEAVNMKMAMFFLAFIPQFVSPDHALAPQFVILGTTCVLLNSIMDVIAVSVTLRIVGSSINNPSGQKMMSRLSGATMLTLGALVAMANQRP